MDDPKFADSWSFGAVHCNGIRIIAGDWSGYCKLISALGALPSDLRRWIVRLSTGSPEYRVELLPEARKNYVLKDKINTELTRLLCCKVITLIVTKHDHDLRVYGRVREAS
ncbi:MAG: hypothetical protein ACLPKB_18515 [Xanthobacteraceae bacterium]